MKIDRTSTHTVPARAAQDARSHWQARANRRIELVQGNPADRSLVLKRNENVTAAYAEMYLRDHQPQMIAEMRQGFDYVIAHEDENLGTRSSAFTFALLSSCFRCPCSTGRRRG